MSWVLVIGAGWLGVGAVVAVIVGRSIRLADTEARGQKPAALAAPAEPNFVVDPQAAMGTTTVPSFDALAIDLPAPREVQPQPASHPPVVGGYVPPAERAPVTREHGLA